MFSKVVDEDQILAFWFLGPGLKYLGLQVA